MLKKSLPIIFLSVLAIVLWSVKPVTITVTLGGQVEVRTGNVTNTQACAFAERLSGECTNPQNPGPDGRFRIQFEVPENGTAYLEFTQEGYTRVRKRLDKELSNKNTTISLAEPVHLVRLLPPDKINKANRLRGYGDTHVRIYFNQDLDKYEDLSMPQVEYFQNIRFQRYVKDWLHQEEGGLCKLASGNIYQTQLKIQNQQENSDRYYLFEVLESSPCSTHLASRR